MLLDPGDLRGRRVRIGFLPRRLLLRFRQGLFLGRQLLLQLLRLGGGLGCSLCQLRFQFLGLRRGCRLLVRQLLFDPGDLRGRFVRIRFLPRRLLLRFRQGFLCGARFVFQCFKLLGAFCCRFFRRLGRGNLVRLQRRAACLFNLDLFLQIPGAGRRLFGGLGKLAFDIPGPGGGLRTFLRHPLLQLPDFRRGIRLRRLELFRCFRLRRCKLPFQFLRPCHSLRLLGLKLFLDFRTSCRRLFGLRLLPCRLLLRLRQGPLFRRQGLFQGRQVLYALGRHRFRRPRGDHLPVQFLHPVRGLGQPFFQVCGPGGGLVFFLLQLPDLVFQGFRRRRAGQLLLDLLLHHQFAGLQQYLVLVLFLRQGLGQAVDVVLRLFQPGFQFRILFHARQVDQLLPQIVLFRSNGGQLALRFRQGGRFFCQLFLEILDSGGGLAGAGLIAQLLELLPAGLQQLPRGNEIGGVLFPQLLFLGQGGFKGGHLGPQFRQLRFRPGRGSGVPGPYGQAGRQDGQADRHV